MNILPTNSWTRFAFLMLFGCCPALADNIDLVTLPKREKVQLTIYNSEDLTMAKETRSLTIKRGKNQLQFSWAGTLIDPTSVELRLLAHQNEIEVVDTVYPGQKPQHLIWNIESKFEGQVPVEVSYFTSGISWSMDYVAVTDPEETQMGFQGFVRVRNGSGEEYENAEIRLIVGKINLVEKIAVLAQRNGIAVPKPSSAKYREMSRLAARQAYAQAEKAKDSPSADDGEADAKKIVKEGVSEYFMFSVEGTETVGNGWSKRMRAVDAADVKFDTIYRMRAYQYGPRPVRFFIWTNDKKHQLGDSPLPNGIVRVFRRNADDGLSFLGQQLLRYVPIQAKVEVNLGTDDLVVYRRRRTGTKRQNFLFSNTNRVSGWDEIQDWTDSFRNYRAKPIKVELRLKIPGDIELRAGEGTKLFDFQTSDVKLNVPARGQTPYPYQVTVHHGSRAKQNRILLK